MDFLNSVRRLSIPAVEGKSLNLKINFCQPMRSWLVIINKALNILPGVPAPLPSSHINIQTKKTKTHPSIINTRSRFPQRRPKAAKRRLSQSTMFNNHPHLHLHHRHPQQSMWSILSQHKLLHQTNLLTKTVMFPKLSENLVNYLRLERLNKKI